VAKRFCYHAGVRGRGPLLFLSLLTAIAALSAQQAAGPVAVPLVVVRPITPPRHPLPPEDKTAGVTRFSFLVYGDTRSGANGDGQIVHPVHSQLVDAMLQTIEQRRRGRFPVRFVLHTGDAVLSGADGRMWNVSFGPIVERLIRDADMPYFFTTGNHDATAFPAIDGGRARGMHNTISAMSGLIPAEGEPRRLNGYLTYAFGYGNVFVIAVDSNQASDPLQLAWVSDQLARLDRVRFPTVVVFLHHPPFSSGPHGVGTLEAQTLAVRSLYMPLFRRHHVRLLLAGHDHVYDHWVERYRDGGRDYRLDELVTGGGGAPTYTYRGEPDLTAYVAAGSAMQVRLEHLARPATTVARNPNHFVVIEIDGEKISSMVVAPNDRSFGPFDGRAEKALNDANTADTH
jgi:3',5'-cyclic AMP phosphodiesterase CpdA